MTSRRSFKTASTSSAPASWPHWQASTVAAARAACSARRTCQFGQRTALGFERREARCSAAAAANSTRLGGELGGQLEQRAAQRLRVVLQQLVRRAGRRRRVAACAPRRRRPSRAAHGDGLAEALQVEAVRHAAQRRLHGRRWAAALLAVRRAAGPRRSAGCARARRLTRAAWPSTSHASLCGLRRRSSARARGASAKRCFQDAGRSSVCRSGSVGPSNWPIDAPSTG